MASSGAVRSASPTWSSNPARVTAGRGPRRPPSWPIRVCRSREPQRSARSAARREELEADGPAYVPSDHQDAPLRLRGVPFTSANGLVDVRMVSHGPPELGRAAETRFAHHLRHERRPPGGHSSARGAPAKRLDRVFTIGEHLCVKAVGKIEWATKAVKDMRRLAAPVRARIVAKVEQYAADPAQLANNVPRRTGQIRPLVDTANPAIFGEELLRHLAPEFDAVGAVPGYRFPSEYPHALSILQPHTVHFMGHTRTRRQHCRRRARTDSRAEPLLTRCCRLSSAGRSGP